MKKENIKEAKKQRDKEAKRIAFSLAEMMLVLLIMTIVLAMIMPIISKRKNSRPVLTETIINTHQPLYTYGKCIYDAWRNYAPCSSSHYTSDGINLSGGGICKDFGTITMNSETKNVSCPLYPPECPPDWTDLGVGESEYTTFDSGASWTHFLIRSCWHPSKNCSVLYLHGTTQGSLSDKYDSKGTDITMGGGIYTKLTASDGSGAYSEFASYPPKCPSDWLDAGVGYADTMNLIRSCYKCN